MDVNKEVIEQLKKKIETTEVKNCKRTEQQGYDIIKLIIDGYPRHQIAQKICEDWGVTSAQAYKAWKKAEKIITEAHSNIDMGDLKSQVLARYEDLYRAARRKGYEQVAANILKEYAKLAGIDDDKLSNQSITINLQPYEDKL